MSEEEPANPSDSSAPAPEAEPTSLDSLPATEYTVDAQGKLHRIDLQGFSFTIQAPEEPKFPSSGLTDQSASSSSLPPAVQQPLSEPLAQTATVNSNSGAPASSPSANSKPETKRGLRDRLGDITVGAQKYIDDHWPEMRASLIIGTAAAVVYLITTSRSFKRVRAYNLPDFVFPRKKLRGTVVHVSPEKGTFEIYHQPLFRSLFWIDLRQTVQFRKDTIPMQLAGLNLANTDHARHRFKELLENKKVVVQLVEKPKNPETDYVPGIVWQRNFRNVNVTLLREGQATCHDYDIPAQFTMETRLPRMWRKFDKADQYARFWRIGMHEHRPPSTRTERAFASSWYYLKRTLRGFRSTVFGRKAL